MKHFRYSWYQKYSGYLREFFRCSEFGRAMFESIRRSRQRTERQETQDDCRCSNLAERRVPAKNAASRDRDRSTRQSRLFHLFPFRLRRCRSCQRRFPSSRTRSGHRRVPVFKSSSSANHLNIVRLRSRQHCSRIAVVIIATTRQRWDMPAERRGRQNDLRIETTSSHASVCPESSPQGTLRRGPSARDTP